MTSKSLPVENFSQIYRFDYEKTGKIYRFDSRKYIGLTMTSENRTIFRVKNKVFHRQIYRFDYENIEV